MPIQATMKKKRMTPYLEAERSSAQESDERAAALLVAGRTLQEVADMLGVSRERVRQRVKRLGVDYRHRAPTADPIAIMRELRRRETLTCGQIGRATDASSSSVSNTLKQLDVWDAALRLFRWRKQRQLLDRFATLAESLGHTPTAVECRAAGLWQGTLQKEFGGLQAAARRCGLPPNAVGNPSLQPRAE